MNEPNPNWPNEPNFWKYDLDEAIHLLEDLTDDEACIYDHNSWCQTHYSGAPGELCKMEAARRFLARKEEIETIVATEREFRDITPEVDALIEEASPNEQFRQNMEDIRAAERQAMNRPPYNPDEISVFTNLSPEELALVKEAILLYDPEDRLNFSRLERPDCTLAWVTGAIHHTDRGPGLGPV